MKALTELRSYFPYWEITKDLIDQCIDVTLNLRQSGHPGGSRSKVHGMIVTLLSGAMRWDIREPEKRFADRYVLVAGHCNPMVYATLAVFNEALRIKYRQTKDERYRPSGVEKNPLVWEDLLTLRQRNGLPGHAEMEGKTLFFKANTGPSGHGSPFAAGEALALKFAGVPEVKVFAFEGEGGLTTGATHETLNSAWGLGLENLVYFVDWNDFGIDDRPFSSIMYGTPKDWFSSHGWHVEGTEEGESWEELTGAYYRLLVEKAQPKIPKIIYAKSRKGRGYYVYDNKSHGAAHKRNSELFWKTKEDFAKKYNVDFQGFGEPAAANWNGQLDQASSMFKTIFSVMENNPEYLDYLANTLVELGDSVPRENSNCSVTAKNPAEDPDLFSLDSLPAELFAAPGTAAPNRAGFAKYASYINTLSEKKYRRPLVLAMSADLAGSTNLAGFAKVFGESRDRGLYHRDNNPGSPILPQGITEFTNSGMLAGAASVNFNDDPTARFNGFFGAMSTYGSFSYLKYGPLRLFSQMAQDSQLKMGKIIWVAGHSGPETAEDSRTHFGVFAPGVTELFPDGQVINLHPWEHNEVAPCLAAALSTDVPIIALHLTRPSVTVPDREALGMGSYMDAAKGAYVIKDYTSTQDRRGLVLVRGTSSTDSLIRILPRLQKEGPNVKIVAAISWELFQRQSEEYRNSIVSPQEWQDAMVITNGARSLMQRWIVNPVVEEYTMSPDFDNRWRSGGSLEQIVEESRLDSESLWKGIVKFADERDKRLERLRKAIPN